MKLKTKSLKRKKSRVVKRFDGSNYSYNLAHEMGLSSNQMYSAGIPISYRRYVLTSAAPPQPSPPRRSRRVRRSSPIRSSPNRRSPNRRSPNRRSPNRRSPSNRRSPNRRSPNRRSPSNRRSPRRNRRSPIRSSF